MENYELKTQLNGIKDYVLNRVLVIVLFVQMIGLTISIMRMIQTGFKLIYGVHIALVALVIFIYFFKNVISTNVKGGLFMVALYTLAISGLSSWGLYGFGYIYFIPATAIAFLYFNKKTAWILTGLSFTLIGIIGLLFARGVLGFTPDSGNYMQSFSMWLNMVITLSLITIVITFFWNNIFGMLMKTYNTINEQQKHLEHINEELIIARDKAEQSDKMKSSFLANISHEIRTPLNIIIGFTQMIAETPEENERQELQKTVRENSDIMLKLVNDIVDFSKIETNSLNLNPTEFNLKEVIVDVEKRLKFMIEPQVTFEIEKPDIKIHADKNRINQIIFNLLHNALKFTNQGAVSLKCQLNQENIQILVCDTGMGIASEHQERIFDRFFKVDTFCQGSGLGLSLSRSIAILMNGDIKVNSELGKGSTFEFIIPITVSDQG